MTIYDVAPKPLVWLYMILAFIAFYGKYIIGIALIILLAVLIRRHNKKADEENKKKK